MKQSLLLALLLIASTVYGGGLYDETQTPIAGTVTQYRRMPSAQITNALNAPPSIQMTTETIKLYPDGATQATFLRRVSVGYMDFYGKKYPLLNPADGSVIGTVDGDTLYSLLYSTWILGEKKADGEVGMLHSDPATICYTTSRADPICKLP